MTEAIYLILGRNVRAARKDARLSQEDLAEATGFGRVYISDIERGRASVNLSRLASLAAALGTTPQALITPGKRTKTGA